MARRPVAMPWPEPTRDRRQSLGERDVIREERKQFDRCHKINTRPGFQTLANMKFNRG